MDDLESRVEKLERNQWFGVFASIVVSGVGIYVATRKPAGSCSCEAKPVAEANTRRRAQRFS